MSPKHFNEDISKRRNSMKILIPVIGLALALSPAAAMAKAHKAAPHAAHAVNAKSSCKGEFMYSKGGKCMDARNKAA
jgi:hypothetical protein